MNHLSPPIDHQHNPTLAPAYPDIATRLAASEAALEAEREKNAMLHCAQCANKFSVTLWKIIVWHSATVKSSSIERC